jgi:hypothetical protein
MPVDVDKIHVGPGILTLTPTGGGDALTVEASTSGGVLAYARDIVDIEIAEELNAVDMFVNGEEVQFTIACRELDAERLNLHFGHGTTEEVAAGAGVNEEQTLTLTGVPDGGSFTITFGGQTTAAIAFDATAAEVEAALELLSSIGAGNVSCSGGPLPGTAVVIEFIGDLAQQSLALATADGGNLTGGTTPDAAIAETTDGEVGAGYEQANFGGSYQVDRYNLEYVVPQRVNSLLNIIVNLHSVISVPSGDIAFMRTGPSEIPMTFRGRADLTKPRGERLGYVRRETAVATA